MALDVSQTPVEQILFIDDRPLFVEVAQSLGIHAIHYQGLDASKILLNKFGLHQNSLVHM
jgi:putative hydrolase of the HAD superfamily